MKLISHLAIAGAMLLATGAQAAASLDLSRYSLSASYSLDVLGGRGLEASAVTYARDRGTLFFVGDEGLGVVEISRTGQTVGSMSFDWTGTGSTHNDTEGLAYLGNGQLVVVDERPQMAYRFNFTNGGTVALNAQAKVALTGSAVSVGNVGTEGISFDPRDGSFFSVKQDNPAQLRQHTVNFAVGGGTSTNNMLLSGASSVLGLNSLSDVQTLAGVDALVGTTAADNLLLLSLDSLKLVEVTRSGTILGALDLSRFTTQAIEGITIDEKGVIYLVAEGFESRGVATPSQLLVLTPVPEPQTYALLLAGLGVTGLLARRRRA
ncbi:MAG: FxDxF family PEP-CTERM protein [Burkholderiales bacterium]|nr:FxDxF family PEP-CTERM protein [Burkholderiales bacterium]